EMPPPPSARPPGMAVAKQIRVAVLAPTVDASVEGHERLALVLGQLLTAEIRKLQKVTAIASDEIQQMVSFQRSRQVLGCSEDSSCMAELVDALAADELISMRVGQIGASYSLGVQRLDLRRAKVLQSFTRQVPRGSGEELLAVIGPIVEALYP